MKEKTPLKVSIIVLTWNQKELTSNQLKDVSKLDVGGFDVECIVCDNGSTDGTEGALKNYKLPNMDYKFIQNGSNLGFAAGNNRGVKDAIKRGADFVIF